MAASRKENEISNRPPDLIPISLVLPSRTNTVPPLISPRRMKDRESRTPSPKKRKSVSPKKIRDNPLPVSSASTSAQAQPIKPTTANHDHRNSALQPRSHYINDGSYYSNLPFSASKIASENSRLDVYAPSYTPLWLRAVNESIAVTRYCPLLETINFPEYISSFAGRQYLHPLGNVELPPIHNVVPFHSVSPELLTPKPIQLTSGR